MTVHLDLVTKNRKAAAAAAAVLAASVVSSAATSEPIDAIISVAGVIVSPFDGSQTSHGFPALIACTAEGLDCRPVTTADGVTTGGVYRLVQTVTTARGSTASVLGLDAVASRQLVVCSPPANGSLSCRALPSLPPSADRDGVYELAPQGSR